MARNAAARRSAASRRSGYIVAIIVNGALLYLINARPGWQAVPFLTPATRQVLGVVNLVLALNVAVNVSYLAYDGPWLKPIGDLATAVVGLVAAIRIWQVFPFAFHGSASGWSAVVRVLLVVAIVGSCIGILVLLAMMIRRAVGVRQPR